MNTNIPQLDRVLYIDDDPDMRSVVECTLEMQGRFEVSTCGSAREARMLAVDFRPQLILLDYEMPDTNGPAMLSELRQLSATAETPVVFVTAWLPSSSPVFRDPKVADFIVKPFDPFKLPDRLLDIWSRIHRR